MGKYEELLARAVRGTSDANIAFDDLRNLLTKLGFEQRSRGSHPIFRKPGIDEKLNLQREGNKAKPYQVRQVRTILLKYRLGGTP